MRRLLSTALAIAICGGVAADAATAKGVDMGATAGVTVGGSSDRYVAISPRIPQAVTVVGRVERRGGRLERSWYLRGRFQVPAVAYDLSAGGLSADGKTLVLSRMPNPRVYPPRTTRFAILDTQRSFRWRGRGRPPRFRQIADFIELRGHYSFDAISPDGSTVYLIHHYLPPRGPDYITKYEVRALDLKSGELLPRPIVDPSEPDEQMQGLPVTRASSPDGRWAYTFYDGNGEEPFIHALDTVGRRAVCVDLPQLEGRHDVFTLRLRVEQGGRQLTVMSGPPPPQELPPLAKGRPVSWPQPHPLLSVDMGSFEVTRPDRSGENSDESSLVAIALGAGAAAFAFAAGWLAWRKRRGHLDKEPKTA